MALRRITIDIDDSGFQEGKRLLYGVAVVSENGREDHEQNTAEQVHSIIEYAVDAALDSLKP